MMHKRKAEQILFRAFESEDILGAFLTMIQDRIEQLNSRFTYRGQESFHDRAANLIEHSGGIMVLESLDNEIRTLRQRMLAETQSPSEDDEQD